MGKQKNIPAPDAGDIALRRGLPSDLDTERMVLGAILLEDAILPQIAARLKPEDFFLEKHRRIYDAIKTVGERGDRVDRVMVANELKLRDQLESCDGLSYLISLDDGLPTAFRASIDSYVEQLKRHAGMRQVISLCENGMAQALLNRVNPNELVQQIQSNLLDIDQELGRAQEALTTEQAIMELPGGMSQFLDPTQFRNGYPTGLYKLDEMLTGGGLQPGNLYVLAARPSMGKTALATALGARIAGMYLPEPPEDGSVDQYADQRTPGAVFTIEMDPTGIIGRLVSAKSGIPLYRQMRGAMSQEERNRWAMTTWQIMKLPVYWDGSAGLTISELESKCTRLKASRGIKWAIIDYLQLMSQADLGEGLNANAAITKITRRIKLLAKRLDIAVILVSQLSRAPEKRTDPRPQMADLRDSGSIEQDADFIGFVFREEVYKPDREDLRDLAELGIAKQRQGPIGKVKLRFTKALTKFDNLTEDIPEELRAYA